MRNKLIEGLAYKWRYAENFYLENEDDGKKREVLEYQNTLNLTDEEIEELHNICNSMGV